MKQSFNDFLTTQNVDSAVIQEAALLYLGEATDDLSPDEMRSTVAEKVGDSALVESALEQFRHDPALTEKVLQTLLAQAWDRPGEEDRIRRVFNSAKKKLPIIDPLLIGIGALYCLYLSAHFFHVAATGDATKTTTIEKHGADGSYEKTTTVETTPPALPASPASAVGSLFSVLIKKESKQGE
jgi:hypothetical protein